MTNHAGVHEKGSFSLQDLMETIKKNSDFAKTGAIGLFVGLVRGENNEGQTVQKLTLEAYEEKANEVLETICADLQKRPGIVEVQIHHLLGEFNVGEDLVYVSVAGSHRPEVFSVLREAVERYKHEAPVFKKEQTVNQKGETQASWVSEKQNSPQ
ncbi:MAG: molybdenum cofactor biosynthesis protein MoaE [Candidatus Bathyarchaeota archaeon]|nr:molybdenum cofactor biosynthesis protein MoaE [Candidatus Bathyarchaeota archaeon]